MTRKHFDPQMNGGTQLGFDILDEDQAHEEPAPADEAPASQATTGQAGADQ
ncbi:hypothetical protein ACIBEA_40365 [Streptomyces sp. NPDC051555]|uniref:hypothetical protein n=1 Tax=Streptomyces sp. NPDC051555 TaxID=3365657 RepID=UPI003794DE55